MKYVSATDIGLMREENQDMVRYICEKYPFTIEEEKQILPGLMEADGFYYAKLRRNK